MGLILGSGRSPAEGNGNPLQYSCLENPMDSAWRATVHGVAKSWTQLSTAETGQKRLCVPPHPPHPCLGLSTQRPQASICLLLRAGEQTWITFLASNKETHNEIQALFQSFFYFKSIERNKIIFKKIELSHKLRKARNKKNKYFFLRGRSNSYRMDFIPSQLLSDKTFLFLRHRKHSQCFNWVVQVQSFKPSNGD